MMPSKRMLKVATFGAVFILTFIIFSMIWSPSLPILDTTAQTTNAVGTKRHRIVASISTFPGRMDELRLALKSIFMQSLEPDMVYVHIPKKIHRFNISVDETELSTVVKELTAEFGQKLKVYLGEDYGPSTKLLGTLKYEKNPDTLVLTVDDDTEYHPNMLEMLYKTYLAHPTHFICTVCETLSTSFFERTYAWITSAPYTWHYYNSDGACKGWANAYTGILYKVGMFDRSVYDYENVPRGCVIHDDVYLSGFLLSYYAG